MSTHLAVSLALCGLMVAGAAVGHRAALPRPGATAARSGPWAAVSARMAGPADRAGAARRSSPRHEASRLTAVQVAYLTSCGGCHGVEGASAPHAVPTLRHLTGSFLCTRQGRQFIVRLPDVALSSLSDRMLTRVINWVVFDLGAPAGGWRTVRQRQHPSLAAGRSARPSWPAARRVPPRPYTVAEVARLRREPLTQTGLTPYREQVVAHLEARCAAPAGLSVYGAGYGAGVKSPSPKS